MNQEILLKIAGMVEDLPNMPSVAQELLSLFADPTTEPEEIQRVLSKDPAMSVKVLRISNSAYYRRGREITSLADAIVLLGFKTVQSLVLSSAVHRVLSASGSIAQPLWEHSFAVAMCSKEIARKKRQLRIEPEEAYLAGLFHDIAKGVIANKFPGIYKNTNSAADEMENLGFNHAHLGQVLLTKWEIPPALASAVGGHHEEEIEGLTKLLPASQWIVMHSAPGIGVEKRREPSALLEELEIEPELISELREKIDECLAEERGSHG